MRTFAFARLAALAALVTTAGCNKGPTGYGVHFTMTLDGSISDGDAKSIATLELVTESSVEPFSSTLDATNKFSDRQADLTYRPKVTGGSLTFDFRVRDGGGRLLGIGQTEVALVPGTMVESAVRLVNPLTITRDMGPTYDLIILDLSMPDLAAPPPPPDMAKMPRDMTMVTPPDMSMPPPPADMSAVPDMATGD